MCFCSKDKNNYKCEIQKNPGRIKTSSFLSGNLTLSGKWHFSFSDDAS